MPSARDRRRDRTLVGGCRLWSDKGDPEVVGAPVVGGGQVVASTRMMSYLDGRGDKIKQYCLPFGGGIC